MDAKELTQKNAEELRRLAAELQTEIRDLRFKIATRQALKVRTIRHKKRDLARVQAALSATNHA